MSGLKRKLKFSTVDIEIKQSGLMVSNSKVFSSDRYWGTSFYDINFIEIDNILFTKLFKMIWNDRITGVPSDYNFVTLRS